MPADAGVANHARPSVRCTRYRRGMSLDNVGMTPLLGRDWAEILMRVAYLRAGSAPFAFRQAPTFRARSACELIAPLVSNRRSVIASVPSSVIVSTVEQRVPYVASSTKGAES